MGAMRSRKNQARYNKYLKRLDQTTGCQFCKLDQSDQQYISETEHFKVIRNRFPYSLWDTHPVVDHLMLVPKQHTDTLKSLSASESKEFVELISAYENDGYNIYARTPGSKAKSVIHQHTHLIKIQPRDRRRVVISFAKPYIRIGR